MLKISDFGTARELGEKSTRMTFAGTVSWMAPEVIRNELCSEKVDIWCVRVLVVCLMNVYSIAESVAVKCITGNNLSGIDAISVVCRKNKLRYIFVSHSDRYTHIVRDWPCKDI